MRNSIYPWLPLAILANKALRAYLKYEDQQAAQFQCKICWTNIHTTEEHRHPKLSAARKADLVKCQIVLPFVVAALMAFMTYMSGDVSSWRVFAIMGAVTWPLWAWAVSYRFRKEQRKENEKAYEREEAALAAARKARREQER